MNGDCPEDLLRATKVAMDYREKFRKDVFVNLICFRRWGHNELDDPTFTNPALYSIINSRRSVPDLYAEQVVGAGLLSAEEVGGAAAAYTQQLTEDIKRVESYTPQRTNLGGAWAGQSEPAAAVTEWDTGVAGAVLRWVGGQSVQCPDTFRVHTHLQKHHIEGRQKKLEAGTGLDWGTAEALAIGSLLYQVYSLYSGNCWFWSLMLMLCVSV